MQFQGVIKDISPHKRLEQQLRQSEDRYKTLYEMARISSSSLRLDEVVERSLGLIDLDRERARQKHLQSPLRKPLICWIEK